MSQSKRENWYLARQARKANLTKSHLRAPKQEESLAKRLKAVLVPASGAGPVKGDVQSLRVLRIEAKTTMRQSFSVTREMVDKIEQAAVSGAQLPAIVIEFLDDNGRPAKEVAVVPTYVLDHIADQHDK